MSVLRPVSQTDDARLAGACAEILGALGAADRSAADVRRIIRAACARHSLARIPTNEEILARGAPTSRARAALIKRPVKTASGVAVVSVMPMPYACPHGRCTYCPGGPSAGTPNSYTGAEPIAAGAAAVSYDPAAQVRAALARLRARGHETSKVEVVIVGGTFLFMPAEYREWFVRSCYGALSGQASPDMASAHALNERAASRCVGLTVETKPDYCRRGHVDELLGYGATRVEIGIQCLRERVYRIVNRGHTYADVVESLRVSRDAGYKVVAHMMPGLPTMSVGDDLEDFGRLWEDPDLRPDMLKIYPLLALRGTPLAGGGAGARTEAQTVALLARIKARVPPWVRIMRVQREIPGGLVEAGPRSGNLRQAVHARMRAEGTACGCIRCREAGLAGATAPPRGGLSMRRTDYASSRGDEAFLSMEDARSRVYGYLRLRRPGRAAHRPEARGACIVRELHVLGRQVGVGEARAAIQHSGIGSRLLREAERISAEEHGAGRLLVISAVGTREYYARRGYSRAGSYMAREARR